MQSSIFFQIITIMHYSLSTSRRLSYDRLCFYIDWISIVSQESVLFNCSIEENIAYGFDGNVNSIDLENVGVRFNVISYPVSYLLIKSIKPSVLTILMVRIAKNGQCAGIHIKVSRQVPNICWRTWSTAFWRSETESSNCKSPADEPKNSPLR